MKYMLYTSNIVSHKHRNLTNFYHIRRDFPPYVTVNSHHFPINFEAVASLFHVKITKNIEFLYFSLFFCFVRKLYSKTSEFFFICYYFLLDP